jgi:hypothetical protein
MSTDPSLEPAAQYDTATLDEGERVGRFLIVRDTDGRRHAVAAGAVSVLSETDEGTVLLLPGGRMMHVARSMQRVLRWLDGRS